ncbi:IS200/IS605 family transposase [Algoriphagus confluentis]|uniref:IS200/IS605 family transposase n=1 Tax=Algoriphagus confluentis TaxID=1697556 RepID=A0ABQ6PTI7_9BACT|nr:IS200/IS605 family transposase [Algoriphagus confluentis]
MANTYTQIHIQVVFTVQNRDCIIQETWKNELYKYISGIINNHNHKVLAINGMPDHVHILIGMRPTQSLSELMQDVKGDSSKWINQKKFTKGKFSWQEGFGAFSYSKSHINQVIDYIKNQEEHHKKWSFLEEYRTLLEKFEVEFDQRYIFRGVDYGNDIFQQQ